MAHQPPWRILLALLVGLCLAIPAQPAPAAGQGSPQGAGMGGGGLDIQLTADRSLYGRDDYCGLWDFFITGASLTASLRAVGASVSFVGDYPWPQIPPPPTPEYDVYLDRGPAIQAMVELYPLAFLGEGARELERYVRPFVAGGVQVSQDGETFQPGTERPGPVYAVLGQVDPGVSYGASVRVPLGDGRVGLVARFQGTTLFAGDSEFRSPEGESFTTEGRNLSWSELRIGVSFTR